MEEKQEKTSLDWPLCAWASTGTPASCTPATRDATICSEMPDATTQPASTIPVLAPLFGSQMQDATPQPVSKQ